MIQSLRDPLLIPYYVTSAFYLVIYTLYLPPDRNDVYGAVLKPLPIWYLAIYSHGKHPSRRRDISSTSSHTRPPTPRRQLSATVQEQSCGQDEKFYSYFRRGLLLSSLGDIALEFKGYFQLGLLLFGFAQLLYMMALRLCYSRSRWAWLVVPVNLLAYVILLTGDIQGVDKLLVAVYSVLIHAMLFFAVARYESRSSSQAAFSVAGAASFVISDFLIGYSRWCGYIPHAHHLIMLTYYTAQLFLTMGLP